MICRKFYTKFPSLIYAKKKRKHTASMRLHVAALRTCAFVKHKQNNSTSPPHDDASLSRQASLPLNILQNGVIKPRLKINPIESLVAMYQKD